MSSELTKIINHYKNNNNKNNKNDENNEYIDEYVKSMTELLLKKSENIYNRFILLVNTNEFIELKLVIQKLIDENNINKFINLLLPLKNFDIHALTELLFCIDKEQCTIIVDYLFKIDEYSTEHIEGKWFEEKSKIGILLNKVFKTIKLDISIYRFETEDIKELYRTHINRHTNKIAMLLYKHHNKNVLEWMKHLYNTIKTDKDGINKYYLFYMLQSFLYLFRKQYLLYTEQYKTSLSEYKWNNSTKLDEVNINLIVELLNGVLVNLHKTYDYDYKYVRNNLEAEDITQYKNEMLKLNTIIYNKQFITVYRYYLDKVLDFKHVDLISEKLLTVIQHINSALPKKQFDFLSQCFIEKIEKDNYIYGMEILNNIIDNYYRMPRYKDHNKFMESVLKFCTYPKIIELVDIYDQVYFINFVRDLIVLNKTIENNNKQCINTIINDVIGNINRYFKNVEIYLPKIKNFILFKKLKLYNYLTFNRKTYEILTNEDNKKIVSRSSLVIRELIDLLNQITLYFNKAFIEEHTVKNIVTCFNHILYVLLTKKPNIMKINDRTLYDYHPNKTIKSILFLYAKLNSTTIVHLLSKCNCLKPTHYKKVLNIITKDKCEETYTSFRFKYMIQLIEEKRESTIKNKKDIPEKFIDPITCEIMENPVKLPSSEMVVDRITIMNVMQNSKLDPYDRTTLTEDMLIDMKELKEEIDNFISS
jgi:hypothetical protein